MGWLPTLLGQLRLQEDRKGHESLWGGERGWRWQEFTWWEEGNKGRDLFLTPEGEREVLVASVSFPLDYCKKPMGPLLSNHKDREAQAPSWVSSLSPKLRQGKDIPFYGLICHWRPRACVDPFSVFVHTQLRLALQWGKILGKSAQDRGSDPGPGQGGSGHNRK